MPVALKHTSPAFLIGLGMRGPPVNGFCPLALRIAYRPLFIQTFIKQFSQIIIFNFLRRGNLLKLGKGNPRFKIAHVLDLIYQLISKVRILLFDDFDQCSNSDRLGTFRSI
jgi:hypothetical protein